MQNDSISIIVPTFNRAAMLKDCLESLICQKTDEKFAFDIVVIDNASVDNTEEIVSGLARKHPNIIHYFYEPMQGHPEALNRGVLESRGNWLAFFDDDELAGGDWLLQLYDVAQGTGAYIVGGEVSLALRDDELARIGSVCRKILRQNKYYEEVQEYTGSHLPGSGNVLIARKLFKRIGVFDTKLIAGGSDIDYFLRAKAARYRMFYAPKAIIWHRIFPERLTYDFLRWDAFRIGELRSYCDYKYRGKVKMLFYLSARIGQAILVNFPLLCIAILSRNKRDIVDRKCLIWQAIGYSRRSLFFISPRIFAQKKFFDYLNFRNGREVGRRSKRSIEIG